MIVFEFNQLVCMHLYAEPSLSVSLSHRLKISQSTKIDTVFGNSSVFEYPENKVRIKLSSFIDKNHIQIE